MAPEDVPNPILRAYDYWPSRGKRNFVGVIRLETMRWGEHPDYAGGPEIITRVLMRERQGGQRKGQAGQKRERREDGGRNPKPRNAGASRSWRKQGTRFSLEPPEGSQPCPHLGFIPVKLISDL